MRTPRNQAASTLPNNRRRFRVSACSSPSTDRLSQCNAEMKIYVLLVTKFTMGDNWVPFLLYLQETRPIFRPI